MVDDGMIKVDFSVAAARDARLDGNFGVEKEMLRVKACGDCQPEDANYMAHSPHPFPQHEEHITRDFCENQIEINTSVASSAQDAVEELALHTQRIHLAIAQRGETLWPFSSPPPLSGEDDVPVAQFEGMMAHKTQYRDYLSERYGKYKMAFCGIHVNFSFGDRLLDAIAPAPEDRNLIYLKAAAGVVRHGWILTALTAASPLLDGSFVGAGAGKSVFDGDASVRAGERGYWNQFLPVIDYSDIQAYARSIASYVETGFLRAPTELYYPVRLKPRGPNRLVTLAARGVSHIELRMYDLNPFRAAGLDARDVEFAQLFLVWLLSLEGGTPSAKEQMLAVLNFKNAARFDIDGARVCHADDSSTPVRIAALRLLDEMAAFWADAPQRVADVLAFQRAKLENERTRYAAVARGQFGGDYARSIMALAVKYQRHFIKDSLQHV
ncbi:MAG: hypothetical protein IJ802_03440 [Kiritimatiellae bacterium]|nr:hypothetical protein [Kiritimatiellia bacterium]